MNAGGDTLVPIGAVESPIRTRADAPRQPGEGAPPAWLVLDPAYAPALDGVNAGSKLVVLTWLHLADRTTQTVHPRDDHSLPLTGVFATRSPDRPNPIGLHTVSVLERDGCRLLVDALEAIDGTPIVDLKVAI
jgi:tRNA-Thr(GGU) m(6)t(6)A37 methyltransferase TsaA